MIGDRVFDVYIGNVEFGRSYEIVPHRRIGNGPTEVMYPDGNGGWTVKSCEPGDDTNKIPFLSMDRRMAEAVYEKLREIFDPKDTISADAVKMQETHLGDMRKIVSKQLEVDL